MGGRLDLPIDKEEEV
jgi:hypothetical protein